jgi:hypothetical protein
VLLNISQTNQNNLTKGVISIGDLRFVNIHKRRKDRKGIKYL